MDRRLQEIALRGDTPEFSQTRSRTTKHIKQTVRNTVLHLDARFGHVELATEIVKLWPEMVGEENERMETPLHEACREEGRMEIVRLLMEMDPSVVNKANRHGESTLLVACERGRAEVVKHLLLNYPWMLMLEVDALTTSLRVAASAGHTEVVKELLQLRPDFAWKKDGHGCTPLHIACSKGHLEITRDLLPLDTDLSSLQDNDGRTPPYCATIKARVNILDEILSVNLEPAQMITQRGETVLKNNQYEAVRYLVDAINTSKLVNLPDQDGNTVLHLATAGKLSTMVVYILNLVVDINSLNRKGYTALDVIEAGAGNSGSLVIVPALTEAGAKRCDQLPPGSSPAIQ